MDQRLGLRITQSTADRRVFGVEPARQRAKSRQNQFRCAAHKTATRYHSPANLLAEFRMEMARHFRPDKGQLRFMAQHDSGDLDLLIYTAAPARTNPRIMVSNDPTPVIIARQLEQHVGCHTFEARFAFAIVKIVAEAVNRLDIKFLRQRRQFFQSCAAVIGR